MRFITGLGAAAAATMFLADASAQVAGAPASVPGIGVNAYPSFGGAPIAGPVGARGFYGGGFAGYQNVLGFLGGWGGYGGGYGYGYGAGYGDGYVAPGGNAAVYNYYYHDAHRREGFYGGGGVFYADDGYSRIYVHRLARRANDDYEDSAPAGTGYAPVVGPYQPTQHVFYLSPGPAPRRVGRLPARN